MVKIGGYLSYLTSLLAEFIRKAHRRHGPEVRDGGDSTTDLLGRAPMGA